MEYIPEYYSLTHPQKRIWYEEKLYNELGSFSLAIFVKINGEIQYELLEDAINIVVQQNDGLRLRMQETQDGVKQYISKYTRQTIDWLDFSLGDQLETYEDWAVKTAGKKFAIRDSDLYYFAMIKLSALEGGLYIKLHHIIVDAWSIQNVIDRISKVYESLLAGKDYSDQVTATSYKEFIELEEEYLSSKQFNKDKVYWNNKLADIPYNDKIKRPKHKFANVKKNQKMVSLSDDLITELGLFCRTNKTSVLRIFVSVVYTLLTRIYSQNEIVLGTIMHNRLDGKMQEMIGMLASTVLLRLSADSNVSFTELLNITAIELNDAMRHQKYPYDLLFSEINEKNKSYTDNLFDVMVVYQNSIKNDQGEVIQYYTNGVNFPLTLTVEEYKEKGSIEIHARYRVDYFSDKDIDMLLDCIIYVLGQVIKNPGLAVSDLEIILPQEKQLIIDEFNNTAVAFQHDMTINRLFEECVKKTPDAIAVEYKDEKLTYIELYNRVCDLAWYLRRKGVKADQIVGIMVERSIEMIVGTLAILKSGGAYLPIDPDYPKDRIEYMLTDSKASILLTQEKYVDKIIFDNEIILLDTESFAIEHGIAIDDINTAHNLAYVIYTSGSTGKPKGVMIEHRNVINILTTLQRSYPLTKGDTYLLKTSFTFDVSVTELFGWFFDGGKLAILKPQGEKDPHAIIQAIKKYGVTHMNFAPSMFNLFLDLLSEDEIKIFETVRYVFVAGEAISVETVKKFKRITDKVRLENIYGPTEITIYATGYSITDIDGMERVPIGKPLDNVKAYIVDELLNQQPINVFGELCISGMGVARGYLNSPQLTMERFVTDPFDHTQRMYKTGDLARWLPDGNIEFIGRKDNQVKIRGFRIELGEIENHLLKHELINEAVVIDRLDKEENKYLCAYIVANKDISIQQLRTHLSKEVPNYMIPQHFVFMDKLPLNQSGKINRRALPEPEGDFITGVEYVAPRNEVEEKLVSIWKDVLKTDRIGIDNNFFELGGHSLKATIVMSRIIKELSVEIPLTAMFDNPTISSLSEYIEKSVKKEYTIIKPASTLTYYPLSASQRRVYVLSQVDEEGIQYNMAIAMNIEGKLDVPKMKVVFKELVRRHESFRTSFDMVDEEPVQIIHEDIDFEIEYVEEQDETKIEQMSRSFIRSFDLSKAPLIRVRLVKISEDKFYLLMDIHHIVADGVSLDILFEEITALYKGDRLEQPRLQYKDFAVWQKEYLQSEAIKKQEKCWLDVFSDELPVLDVLTDYKRPVIQSFAGDHIQFQADVTIANGLKTLAEETGTTMYMVLLAAYNILLSKYSGQEDIIVGSTIAGRPYADIQNVVGMFVNTLAMRNQPNKELTFKEFLYKVKENALKAYDNQEYQFEELVEKLGVTRDLSRNPVFDTMFSVQDIDTRNIDIEGVSFKLCDLEYKISKFDFMINVLNCEDEINFNMEYCTELYKKETIKRMSRHFLNILRQIASNHEKKIMDILLITEEEKKKIFNEFNKTTCNDKRENTLVYLFEKQVEKYQYNIALVLGNQKLTYKEVNEKANNLAWKLRQRKVEPGSIVGIMVERSFEMVLATLAIHKAGGAYLPIDPDYPKDRVEYILNHSEAVVLLTREEYLSNLDFDKEVILIDDTVFDGTHNENLDHVNQESDLAYVMYTSGSTGKPKGVMIEHRGVVNILTALYKCYPFGTTDTYLLKTPFTFDVSVTELFGWFFDGGRLAIMEPGADKDPHAIIQAIDQYHVTHINFTASMLNLFLDVLDKEEIRILEQVRYVFNMGEAISVEIAKKFLHITNKVKLEDVYGPTETTIYATNFSIREVEGKERVSIGKPLDNMKAYVVDSNLNLQPIGVLGELCISGIGVARGYLKSPELTRDKFITNPFNPAERMYKTGDLARWLPDGTIDYIGRIDNQVKIRGFRIELGEIENRLLIHESIKESVVIDRVDKHSDKYLCAYIVTNTDVSIQQLREHLSKTLPTYMIPQHFVYMDKLPLNQSGKINRRALPEPEGDIITDTKYEAPRNVVEQVLATIWSEVLGVDKVGINDNFFELGGDSIKAIQVSARLHKQQFMVETRELMMNPMIKQLSMYVKHTVKEIDQGIVEGEVDLTPIQKWYVDKKLTKENHFNQAFMLYREAGFDEETVRHVFDTIVRHHDALRMIYTRQDEKVIQQNRGCSGKLYDIESIDYTNEIEYEEKIVNNCNRIQSSIDLKSGPLVKVCLFKTKKGDHLLIVIHHLVIDGVSFRIILEDFAMGYKQYMNGKSIKLPDKTDSYKKWARRIKEYANDRKIEEEGEYWEKVCEDISSQPDTSYERKERTIKDSTKEVVMLKREETSMLLKDVNKAYNTEINDILLTALSLSIHDCTKKNKILINLEGHGREPILKNIDISRTVGWFTSMYPVVLNMEKTDDLSYQIKTVKETLRQVPNKGINYGIMRYLSHNSKKLVVDPSISFNYLGQFKQDIENEVFKMSDISTGMSMSDQLILQYEVDINAIIMNDTMQFEFRFGNDYNEKNQLAQLYIKNLRTIINHCCQKQQTELTPSDLGYSGISLEELNDISSMIGDI